MLFTTYLLLALALAQEPPPADEPADDLGAVAEAEPLEGLPAEDVEPVVWPWGTTLSLGELLMMITALGTGVGAGIAGIAGGLRRRLPMPATVAGFDDLTGEVQRIARLQGQVQDQQAADGREMRSAAQELRRGNDLLEDLLTRSQDRRTG